MKLNPKASDTDLELLVDRLQKRDQLFNETERFWHAGHFGWNCEHRRFESWSNAFAEILHLPIEGDTDQAQLFDLITDRVHPDDRLRYRGLMASADSYSRLNIEFRVLNAAGEHRFLRQIGIKNLAHEQGGRQALGVLVDVTAQMIEESDSSYNDSLALHAERVVDIGNFIYDDIDDIYLYVSPGCARIHGVSQAEFIDTVESVDSDLEDVYEADREPLRQAYVRFHRTGEDCSVEYRILRPDGETRWIRELLIAQQLKSDGKVALSRGVVQDITEQKNIELELRSAKQNLEKLVDERTRELAETVDQLQQEIKEREKISAELEFLANHDPLTGLPSLRLCKDRLERSLAESRRSKQMAAIMFVDLDGFKSINDNYSHEFGDVVLKTTANRIKAEIRETDTVARIGGDEFLVILNSIPKRSIIERIAKNLIQQVSQAIAIDGLELVVGVSIGIAIYPENASNAEELIRLADKAMYQVKNKGKNSYEFFSPDIF